MNVEFVIRNIKTNEYTRFGTGQLITYGTRVEASADLMPYEIVDSYRNDIPMYKDEEKI